MAQLTEHVSKELLGRFGVPIKPRLLVSTAKECEQAGRHLSWPVMVKAQLPVGGRGKAGGIRRADDAEQCAAAFRAVTAVAIGGLTAVDALVESWQECESECYLAIVLDPEAGGPALLFTASGGIDVETTASLTRVPLREDGSVPGAPFRTAAYEQGVAPRLVERLLVVARRLAQAYAALDARIVELNPLGVAHGDELVALDARIIIDDSALFRQPELAAMIRGMPVRRRDELIKEESRLDYVHLGGNVGLISGGAGMTMAAMDLLSDSGAYPAAFLDCSANPTVDGYGRALDLLLADENVEVVLISIFGGLTHVDKVAANLVSIFAGREISKPVVIRLMGSNVEGAEETLAEAGLVNYRELEEAVTAAVAHLSATVADRETVS